MALITTKMISKHISAEEATFSQKAKDNKVDNTPNEAQLKAMELVAEKLFEPLREWYGKPIKINSFFRSPETNKLVKGATNSNHLRGEAIDITGGNKTENKKIFDWCKANFKDFDEIINEYDYTWVHISYKSKGNRKKVITIA
jgi:zinc D-Ala-D-Ala carboxypeptidase